MACHYSLCKVYVLILLQTMEDFNIVYGVMEDVIHLKEKFEACGNLRFVTFSRVWREEKMPLIVWQEIKINIVLEEWLDFLAFHKQMLRCHDNDAAFIFSKLRVDGAFMVSASVRQYGLEKSFRKYYSCKEKMLVEKCGLTPRIQKILDDGSFDDILRVQEKCIDINKSLQQFEDLLSVEPMVNQDILHSSMKKEMTAMIIQKKCESFRTSMKKSKCRHPRKLLSYESDKSMLEENYSSSMAY